MRTIVNHERHVICLTFESPSRLNQEDIVPEMQPLLLDEQPRPRKDWGGIKTLSIVGLKRCAIKV